MNTNEAKFFLRARRPDGRDDADPRFAAALEQARRDPVLAAWLAREQAFDTKVAARLREVMPPEGLRDAILAGARMQRRTPWWRQGSTLGWAAGLALLLAGAGAWSSLTFSAPSLERLALGSMEDFAASEHRPVVMGGRGALGDWLANPSLRLGGGLPLEFERLKTDGCRVVRIAGREVLEVCFQHPQAGELHLYIARRGDFDASELAVEPVFRAREGRGSLAWADARHVYVLMANDLTTDLHAIL